MAVKVFILGSTGYIGGDVFHALATAHPEYELTCLVRSSDKGAKLAAAFPAVRLVYGTLDSLDLVERESKDADIVLSCASADHPPSVRAMVAGLSGHPSDRPGFLVHTSGTGVLMHDDIAGGAKPGTRLSAHVYDDLERVDEVTSLPSAAPHRPTDGVALAAHERGVRAAVVCPPTIYGACRGPAGGRGHQAYELARCTLQRGAGIRVNDGLARWTNVHVRDLSDVFVRLVEAAAAGGGAATWGPRAYYFAEHGEHVWRDVAEWVAAEAAAQGFIAEAKVEGVSAEEADELAPNGSLLWGGNSRGKALRARKVLGWEPKGKSLVDSIPEIVREEAERLGLVRHHAEVAATGEA